MRNSAYNINKLNVARPREVLEPLLRGCLRTHLGDNSSHGVVYIISQPEYLLHVKRCVRAVHKNTGVTWEVIVR